MHELKPIEPANLIRAYQPGLRVPGQRHEEFEVPFAYLRRLFTPQQTVPAVLPDRFEKAIPSATARVGVVRRLDADE